MPRGRDGLNTEVGAIVTEVLGELSLGQAEAKMGYRLSKEGIRRGDSPP